MLTVTLMLLCAAPPADRPKAPPASDMAILFFLAGDLRRAVDTCRLGMKTDPVKCKALYPMLVEYEFLVPRRESLTVAEAKAFVAWDRKISPAAPGKLTGAVMKRFVETPLHFARLAHASGEAAKAKRLLGEALEVDPLHADALALKAQLEARDAGR